MPVYKLMRIYGIPAFKRKIKWNLVHTSAPVSRAVFPVDCKIVRRAKKKSTVDVDGFAVLLRIIGSI